MNPILTTIVISFLNLIILTVLFFTYKSIKKLNDRIDAIDKKDSLLSNLVREELSLSRIETDKTFSVQRKELLDSFEKLSESNSKKISEIGLFQKDQLDTFAKNLSNFSIETNERFNIWKETFDSGFEKIRIEIANSIKNMSESNTKILHEMGKSQTEKLEQVTSNLMKLTDTLEQKFDGLKRIVDDRLEKIREDNSKQLEQMRQTVDEKLQGTLEKRLGDSFKIVSERLELVHRGLGEMQALANNVGDLKKVLSNVKTRGIFGEIQLENLLEQVLVPEQYDKNISTKNNGERVEFAIRLPGRNNDNKEVVWLPIDAKFPMEDYTGLVNASENADLAGIELYGKQLEQKIRSFAKDISTKYINPPITTDFGILYLPVEGLFAEVLRRGDLVNEIQRTYKVIIAGPTTLWSILNSLQMGFRTLAIQKRSGEVWKLLGAVKTEWSKFGDVLDKVKTKLEQATSTIEDAQKKTNTISRKLREVEGIPQTEAEELLTD
ncbi:MAG: DNA recombination protein RmuC [Calditerrivibrio sp.]|nr:DNA recombination protein RmuC [Calditerrivibrio sp.]MCA1980198.1 DNA recombination protein RmuC [Calditerrivibrio sp.]